MARWTQTGTLRNLRRPLGILALGSFWQLALAAAMAQQYIPTQPDAAGYLNQFNNNAPGPAGAGMQRTQVGNGFGGVQTFEYNGPIMGNTQSIPQSSFSRNLYPKVQGLSIPGNVNRFPGTPLMYRTYGNGQVGSTKNPTYGGAGGGGGGGGGATVNGVIVNNPIGLRPNVPTVTTAPIFLMEQYQPVAAAPVREVVPLPQFSPGSLGNGPLGLGNGPNVPFNGPGNLAGPMPAFEQDAPAPPRHAQGARSTNARGRRSTRSSSSAAAAKKSAAKAAPKSNTPAKAQAGASSRDGASSTPPKS